jgi:Cu(I)/Ag(I) efflux system membrane fusion protein
MKTGKETARVLVFIAGGIVFGLIAGWLLFSHQSPAHEAHGTHAATEAEVWTCSMHPQIRQDKPGKCPICAMDLIPVKTAGSIAPAHDAESITISDEAIALADIQTTKAIRRNPVKEIFLYGTIQPDERLSRSEVAHTGGRIEKLFVNFTGETLRPGQKIATLYSPDLLNAQQELLEAAKIHSAQPSQGSLLEAAREKLRLLKLTNSQIYEIERSGHTSPLIDITAQTGGIVTVRKVAEGDYVSQGGVLFELIDLSSVWAMFDAYEADLPYLKAGDAVTYTCRALPGKSYTGKIAFIDPSLDAASRTAKVRVETGNPGLLLKPQMYAQARVEASLGGHADGSLVVPKTAVLWTGKRSIVYVKQPDAPAPTFSLREVELGASLSDAYVILSGIDEGEDIVTGGAFAVDASAQLEGRRSMMNNDAPAASATHASFIARGLCEMCKERIESAAKKVNGVASASWDMETKQLEIEYFPMKTSPGAVVQAVAIAGHDAGEYMAGETTYNALPDCCKYRSG